MLDFGFDMELSDLEIDGYTLKLTCTACPEQYDVYDGERQVGYLRLRHGCFRADYQHCGGETVFYAEESEGDGQFMPHERMKFLTDAVAKLKAADAAAKGGE